MILLATACVALLSGTGVYLLLSGNLQRVVLGFLMLSNGVNLMVLSSGPFGEGARPPLIESGATAPAADPLPQAFVLTAIVIGLAAAAFLLAVAVAAYQRTGTDEAGGRD